MLSVGSFFGRGFDSQGYIESFNGNLRDECLNVEVFFNLADARRKLYLWRRDYNHHRPPSAPLNILV